MPVHVPTRVLLAPRSSAVLINEVTNQGSELASVIKDVYEKQPVSAPSTCFCVRGSLGHPLTDCLCVRV